MEDKKDWLLKFVISLILLDCNLSYPVTLNLVFLSLELTRMRFCATDHLGLALTG